MRLACRRALLIAPLLLAVALMSGCPPPALRIPLGYGRRAWAPCFQHDDDLRLPTIHPAAPFFYRPLQPDGAAVSPLGTHIIMASEGGELWLYAVLARAFVRLADSGVEAQFWPDISPWSADGIAVVYVQNGDLVYRRLAGGPRQLTTSGDVFTAALSPNGQQVAYGRRDRLGQDRGLWLAPVAGGEPTQLVPPTGDIFHACCPHWSPDGKWLAFLQAYEGGALGVVAADGSDLRQGIEAAWEPVRWLPDSKTVLFAQVVYGESGDGVRSYGVGMAKTGLIGEGGRHATYALSPDGAKAVVASWRETSAGETDDGKLRVVNLATLAREGAAVKLPGAATRCLWAPDGRQMLVLVNDPAGRGMLWYSADGLAGMKPLAAASSAVGWARLRQDPWWRFGR